GEAVLALAQERIAADEGNRLVERDRIRQSCFERRLVRRELGAPCAAAGLDAQCVDRVVTGVAQSEARPFAAQCVVERYALIGRDAQLVARSADIADAR